MYERVIVATDGSDRSRQAIPTAVQAADAFGCPLAIVHVADAEDPADLDVSGLQLLPGSDVAGSIVAFALQTDRSRLLCLSTRGRGPVGELLFGSVTAEVIRSLHAPLLVVGPTLDPPPGPWRRLLVCLDGSEHAAAIVPVISAWALELELEVSLRYVAYPLGDPGSGEFEVPVEDEVAAAQLRATASALRQLGVPTDWAIVEHTEVAAGIVETAARGQYDLLALATHGRTGLARLVAGNVALGVIRLAPVPVLTLRPAALD